MVTPIFTVQDFNELKGVNTLHPLISLIDQSKALPIKAKNYKIDLFMVFLKESWCADIIYGRKSYDYQDGSMMFMGPGQEFGLEYKDLPKTKPNGYALIFHKDLLEGTSLKQKINDYHFFSYYSNEALHVSKQEKDHITELFKKIANELLNPIDKHTRELLVAHIDLLLHYCKRYYERQFHTREQANLDLSEKLNEVLNQYFEKELQYSQGPPSVSYCADSFNLSNNYFGDLVKQQLGLNALSFIHEYLIDKAKFHLKDNETSIKEVSLTLGFDYPNHFSRFFKEKTGISPSEYRDV